MHARRLNPTLPTSENWYQILNCYEVGKPLSINLKGGYHISCPYGYVGRGRVRVVITRAELAPTRYRDGSPDMRVLPSQGCRPKPQAVALSEWCSLVRFDRTAIAGRVRLRDKPCKAGIRADPLYSGRRPALSGKRRAEAPGRGPG